MYPSYSVQPKIAYPLACVYTFCRVHHNDFIYILPASPNAIISHVLDTVNATLTLSTTTLPESFTNALFKLICLGDFLTSKLLISWKLLAIPENLSSDNHP